MTLTPAGGRPGSPGVPDLGHFGPICTPGHCCLLLARKADTGEGCWHCVTLTCNLGQWALVGISAGSFLHRARLPCQYG